MSDLKQQLHEMIDALPESKVIYFVRIVSDIKSMLEEEEDALDTALNAQADAAVQHGDFVSLDTAMKDMGFTLEQIQH